MRGHAWAQARQRQEEWNAARRAKDVAAAKKAAAKRITKLEEAKARAKTRANAKARVLSALLQSAISLASCQHGSSIFSFRQARD